MKKILILVAAMFAMTLTSCEPEGGASKLSIMGTATSDGVIEFIVTTSSPRTTYICGLLPETILTSIGGESQLPAYINTQLSNNPEIHTGHYAYSFSGDPLAVYYYYAAEVKGGKMVGAPVLSEGVKSNIPYKRITSDMVAFNISDNGIYVVGNSENKSFIYNRATDENKIIEGANLYDISNDGIAVGINNDNFMPVIYDIADGEIVPVSLPEDCTSGALHGISPDGTKYYGYAMYPATQSNPMPYRPMVIDNGTFQLLSIEGTIFGNSSAITGSVSQCAVASNGYSAGYIYDAKYGTYSGVIWDAEGEMTIIGSNVAGVDSESGLPTHIFRGMFTRISPNGQWVASEVEDYQSNEWGDVYPYLYNNENFELTIGNTDESILNYPTFTVSAVSDDGLVYISDTDMGLSENAPLIWTKDGLFTTLETYLLDTYGIAMADYSDDEIINGTVVATADGGRTLVISGYPGDGTIFTDIYSF